MNVSLVRLKIYSGNRPLFQLDWRTRPSASLISLGSHELVKIDWRKARINFPVSDDLMQAFIRSLTPAIHGGLIGISYPRQKFVICHPLVLLAPALSLMA